MKRSGTSSGEIDEDRSGGGTRDESPAPSAGSDFSIAPGDSEVSGSEGYASSDGKSVLQGEGQGTPLSPQLREGQRSPAIEAHTSTIAAM